MKSFTEGNKKQSQDLNAVLLFALLLLVVLLVVVNKVFHFFYFVTQCHKWLYFFTEVTKSDCNAIFLRRLYDSL